MCCNEVRASGPGTSASEDVGAADGITALAARWSGRPVHQPVEVEQGDPPGLHVIPQRRVPGQAREAARLRASVAVTTGSVEGNRGMSPKEDRPGGSEKPARLRASVAVTAGSAEGQSRDAPINCEFTNAASMSPGTVWTERSAQTESRSKAGELPATSEAAQATSRAGCASTSMWVCPSTPCEHAWPRCKGKRR